MRRITSLSITYYLGFLLVLILMFKWFVVTAVAGSGGFKQKLSILTSRHQPLVNFCDYKINNNPSPIPDSDVIGFWQGDQLQPILASKDEAGWRIDIYNQTNQSRTPVVAGIKFKGLKLTRTYQPIYNQILFPQCLDNKCFIINWSIVDNRQVDQINVIDAQNVALGELDNVFFDNQAGLVSYTTFSTDMSGRIVLDFKGKLLQSIDETPGINRILTFITYIPETKQLLYEDNQTNIRTAYQVDNISLKRITCP